MPTIVGIAWLAGYIRPVEFASVPKHRRRNAVFTAFARYAARSLNSGLGHASINDLLDLARREMGLRFLQVWLQEGPALAGSSGEADPATADARGPAAPAGHATGGSRRSSGKSGAPDPARLLLIEKVKTHSSDGQAMIVLYQFDHAPDSHETQDVSACLAHLCEQVIAARLDARVLPAGADNQVRILAMK